MNEEETYMTDFMKIFESLELWGPGSEEDSLRALSLLPDQPKAVLEIGCGKGPLTPLLAHHTGASITAVDNEPRALNGLKEKIENQGLSGRINPVCASMRELPFVEESFDLIWSEGSAYIMGVTRALAQWKRFLQEGGFLVISDLVWLTDRPSPESEAFWRGEYPDMQPVDTRLRQMQEAGYELIEHFPLSIEAWRNYIDPLRERVRELQPVMKGSAALEDLERELDLYDRHLGDEFGYHFFILRRGG
jgi:ubiquinone/menaquinone biosynthesis C-methylase UbiE